MFASSLNNNFQRKPEVEGHYVRKWRDDEGILNGKKERQPLKRRHVQDSIVKEEEVTKDNGLTVEMINGIRSKDSGVQLSATTEIRKLISTESEPLISKVINTGIIPRIVSFLEDGIDCRLQFEAAWILTNVSSGSSKHTCLVVESGAVPPLVRLMSSDIDDVREQAVWALGNIAGDSDYWRDFVVAKGILPPLLTIVDPLTKSAVPLSTRRIAVWTLSNLSRGQKPTPNAYQMLSCVPILGRIFRYDSDSELLADSCWALSYLAESVDEILEAIATTDACRRLVSLLSHEKYNVVSAALRAIGNLLAGDDYSGWSQAIIQFSVLPRLLSLLDSSKKSIRKDACWTISNITAGNSLQIQKVVDENIFPRLVGLLQTAEVDVQRSAAWAVVNATYHGSAEQIRLLVKLGVIRQLCRMLLWPGIDFVRMILNGLENILKVGQADADKKGTINIVAEEIQEYGGLHKMDVLLCHDNENVYRKCFKILESYFNDNDENLDEMWSFK